jgi:hypothetical protein
MQRLGEGVMHALKTVLSAAADVIGISEDELRQELRSGKSIAEVAEENDVDRDDLEEEMIEQLEDAIDQARADGKLTQEQADRLKDGLEKHIDRILDRKGGMQGGPGMPDGSMRPFMRPERFQR